MAKDPAFLFYYQDFLVGTDEFTNEEVGAYIKCLCIQAAKGGISEKHMKIICKSPDVHEIIRKKFVWYPEEEMLRNDRLREETEKRKKYCESRSSNKKGKKHTKITSSSYDQHMEDENTCIIIKDLESKKSFNGESQKEKESATMLIIEMNKTWVANKPDYSALHEVDYPALLQIAYFIAGRKGWTKHSTTDIRETEVLESWNRIVVFLTSSEADAFLKRLTLDGLAIPKNMQKVEEAMKNSKSEKERKRTELEKNRIDPAQYFKE